jgi:putative polyketide hydroxylase
MPEIEIEIKSILPWESAVRVVEGFQQGRVFLAGDAAHQMPPWGGQGANTGVQDAHNLAWKLAAVLKGQAAPALLTTYDPERQPIGRRVAEESGMAAADNGSLSLERSGATFAARQSTMLGYGYQYTSQAVIAEAGAELGSNDMGLDGRPGTRAPHAWFERQGQSISTLDLFGTSFVLLAGPAGMAWCEAARAISARRQSELVAYSVGPTGELLDPESSWQAKAGIAASGALLVRPDGFVAWRAGEPNDDPEQQLEGVLNQLLLA